MTFDFNDKIILVTGGGAGIGRACAEAFAKAGGQIVIAENNEDHRAQIQEALPKATVIDCDVTKPSDVEKLAKAIEDQFGRLDVLINNVGHYVHAQPFETLTLDQIDEIINVNLRQLLNVTHAAIPLLKTAGRGASIVNITSIEAYRAIPTCTTYAACKAAITGFTKSLALELGPLGIRVNDVAPETTDTPQCPIEYMIPDENKKHIKHWIPLGRFGKPDDCANAALYLASPMAEWVTGTAINVDGGALAAAGWTRDENGTWTIMPIAQGNGMNL